ncbi:MAG TPA: hypothetical protein VGF79_07175 [Bacteroidia bacterium]
MKNGKLLNVIFPLMVVLLVLFSTESCKKKEEVPEGQKFGVDPVLYGTWKTNDLNEVYYEFLKDSNNTCYWMRQSGIRSMDLMAFKLSQGSIKFGGITYPSYRVVADTLLLYDKNKKVIDSLFRKDNSLINYRTWLKSIKVLETYEVPQGYIPQSSADFTNFGIERDTLYYFHNFNRIVKFSPKANQYYDSLNHFMINSFCIDGPALYYLSDGEVYKTDRYLNSPTKLGLKINYGRSMSLDPVSKTFYVMYGFTGNDMYAGKEGGTLGKLDKFRFLNASPDATLYYKNNQFVELSNGKLYMSQYDGNTCSHVNSYALIPGYDYIGYISTNGNETWLTASKSVSGKTKLFKVDLD